MIDFEKIVSDFCKEHRLSIQLSTQMPQGYETANGSFDIAQNTLFFNSQMLADAPDPEALFALFHELRHVLQYKRPECFRKAIRSSLDYVLMYDGTCFKRAEGGWQECRLEGSDQELLEAYLGQPYELDANEDAYQQVQRLCGPSPELDQLYSMWIPKHRPSDEEYQEIYRKIDRMLQMSDTGEG